MKKLCVIIFCALVSSCSVFQPAKTPTITQYVIHSIPRTYVQPAEKPLTLMITAPKINALYDTTQIIYSDQPHQTNSYAVSRWARKPGQMLLPLMVQTLQQSRYFHAVVAAPFMGHYDYALSTHILCLQQIYGPNGAYVKLIIKAQIISQKTQKIVQQRVFTITEPMPYCSIQSGVVATNRAVEKFLSQLTTLATTQIDAQE